MLTIEHLHKAYGDKQVLLDFSCSLEPGGFYLLTGKSGVGKTTLLHILMGLTLPDSGRIPQGLRCSAVFQENRLLPGRTPVQNLRPVCSQKPEEIRGFLAQILPRDCLEQKVEALSGGMQRRVAIARAMIAPSDVVLMDEPFTGLDAGTAEDVIAFILRHQGGRTLIIATHQEELLSSCPCTRIELREL